MIVYNKHTKVRIMLSILCFCLFKLSLAQSPVGTFQSSTEDLHATITLSIDKDKTYKFKVIKSWYDEMSAGSWICKNDTIYLFDKMSKGFDIHVKESYDKLQRGVKFNYAIYPDSSFEPNVALVANGDTNTHCLISAGECSFPPGFLKNFKLKYGNKLESEFYKVKSRKSNVFNIIINTTEPLVTYRHLKDVKLAIKSNHTVEIIDSQIPNVGSPVYLYRTSSGLK